jgi:NDP-sugar pyrophosphorylase family protein
LPTTVRALAPSSGEADVGAQFASVVGVVPAAGRAKRISPLPCSKEIFPIGFRRGEDGRIRPRAASHHLFEKFSKAGATKAFVILREGKWDIPAYFGDGRLVGLDLAYIVIGESIGPPDTLDRAYPFVNKDAVIFGFPDILFGPDDVFEKLLDRFRETEADVVLGLYEGEDTRTMDVVKIDDEGRVQSIVLKPPVTDLRHGWLCAVWSPAFTEFMHAFVKRERSKDSSERRAYRQIDPQGDLPVGAAIKGALDEGLRMYGVVFPDERFCDIGVPEHLVDAVRKSATTF